MSIHDERVRAQKLARLAGLDEGPWQNAEQQLADVIAAERQRALDAERERDLAEAQEFKKSHESHAIARAEIENLRRLEAEKNQEIHALGEAGKSAYDKCAYQLTHAAGALTLAQLRDNKDKPPSRLLPPKTTSDEFLLAAHVHELMVEAQSLRRQVGNHNDALTGLEKRFPALADLREGH